MGVLETEEMVFARTIRARLCDAPEVRRDSSQIQSSSVDDGTNVRWGHIIAAHSATDRLLLAKQYPDLLDHVCKPEYADVQGNLGALPFLQICLLNCASGECIKHFVERNAQNQLADDENK